MFRKILVANRGEIAVRVMRACRELGIETVAVYSTADTTSFHRVYADECHWIGEAEPKESYLNMDRIIDVAKKTGCEAIHPGYGFLAENWEFALRCEEEGIKFVGPKAETIRAMGSKLNARKLMEEAKVPVIPGSSEIKSVDDAYKFAEKMGYPIAIKASGGGGGIGISIAWSDEELEAAFRRSKKLGEKYFKDPAVYIEKYLPKPRHIEFQILADEHGNVIHLGERECSIQRRHQKVIEESPSPVVSEEVRQEMGEIAARGAKYIGYTNAGTMEFLYYDGKFYFLEMNTRLQVEHPITELITGIDIVKYQLRIANGEELLLEQKDVRFYGHAIECRIYAEDPIAFMPRTGKIVHYRSPGGVGVRVDSGIHQGCEITPYYDPIISKLSVWGMNRIEAIQRMRRALYGYIIDGVETNIPFHIAVMNNEAFVKGETHTNFIEEQNIKEEVRRIKEEIQPLKKRLSEIFWEPKAEKVELVRRQREEVINVWKAESRKHLTKNY
jgi:pyruvate carboxylase subunit A